MKLVLDIETSPQSFEAENEIENALQDEGLAFDLCYAIEREMQNIMHWRDIRIKVRIAR